MIPLPFPWLGGKQRTFKVIKKYIPPHSFYFEPFCGGGSVFFNKNRADHSVLSDKNLDLMIFYQAIRDNFTEVLKHIYKDDIASYTRDTFMEKFHQDPVKMNLWERAARFYFLQNTSYGGSPHYYEKRSSHLKIERFKKKLLNYQKIKDCFIYCSDKLEKCSIMGGVDYKTQLKHAEAYKQFIHPTWIFVYLDPPYFVQSRKNKIYYNSIFGEEDHEELRDILAQTSFNFILSYPNTQYFQNLYKDFEIVEYNLKYAMDSLKGKQCLKNELLIMRRKEPWV